MKTLLESSTANAFKRLNLTFSIYNVAKNLAYLSEQASMLTESMMATVVALMSAGVVNASTEIDFSDENQVTNYQVINDLDVYDQINNDNEENFNKILLILSAGIVSLCLGVYATAKLYRYCQNYLQTKKIDAREKRDTLLHLDDENGYKNKDNKNYGTLTTDISLKIFDSKKQSQGYDGQDSSIHFGKNINFK